VIHFLVQNGHISSEKKKIILETKLFPLNVNDALKIFSLELNNKNNMMR